MGEFLEYGNVIKIISSDSVYDNKYFFVERLYDNKLVLISDKETITLGITDQILDDTSISEIIIVYKPVIHGYIMQNKLFVDQIIEIELDLDLELDLEFKILTGKITSIRDEVIEVKVGEDILFIPLDRGLPEQIKSIKVVQIKKLTKKEEKEKEIDDGVLDIIEEEIEIEEAQYFYSLEQQKNDLLENLLMYIPLEERNPKKLKNIYKMIRRYTELRDKYTTFSDGIYINHLHFEQIFQTTLALENKLYTPITENIEVLLSINDDSEDKLVDTFFKQSDDSWLTSMSDTLLKDNIPFKKKMELFDNFDNLLYHSKVNKNQLYYTPKKNELAYIIGMNEYPLMISKPYVVNSFMTHPTFYIDYSKINQNRTVLMKKSDLSLYPYYPSIYKALEESADIYKSQIQICNDEGKTIYMNNEESFDAYVKKIIPTLREFVDCIDKPYVNMMNVLNELNVFEINELNAPNFILMVELIKNNVHKIKQNVIKTKVHYLMPPDTYDIIEYSHISDILTEYEKKLKTFYSSTEIFNLANVDLYELYSFNYTIKHSTSDATDEEISQIIKEIKKDKEEPLEEKIHKIYHTEDDKDRDNHKQIIIKDIKVDDAYISATELLHRQLLSEKKYTRGYDEFNDNIQEILGNGLSYDKTLMVSITQPTFKIIKEYLIQNKIVKGDIAYVEKSDMKYVWDGEKWIEDADADTSTSSSNSINHKKLVTIKGDCDPSKKEERYNKKILELVRNIEKDKIIKKELKIFYNEENKKDLKTKLKMIVKKNLYNNLKYNNEKLYLEKEEIGAKNGIIDSPYIDLRDKILQVYQLDIKYKAIQIFIEKYCKKNKDTYWYYCIDTNVKLLPTFFNKLAVAYLITNTYQNVIEEICRDQGTLSDNGDTWVDKYSGYIIKNIEFDNDEGYTETGFKNIARAIIEKNEGDTNILDKNEDKIENSIKSLIKYAGLANIDDEELKWIYSHVIGSFTKASRKIKDPNTLNIMYVISIISNVLIYLQTLKKENIKFVKPFPNCKFSFKGFPLDKEGNAGLTYLCCIISKMEKPDIPFSSVRRIKIEDLEKSVTDYINRFLLTHVEIDEKLKERRQYKEEEIEIIPYSSLKLFLPRLKQFTPVLLTNIGQSYQDIIYYLSFRIQHKINKHISKQNPILINHNQIPFLINTCCNKENNVYEYFITKDPSIYDDLNEIQQLLKKNKIIINNLKHPILYSYENTKKIIMPITPALDEKTLFIGLITLLNFDNVNPIPFTLIKFDIKKPEYYNKNDDLNTKIHKLKEHGYVVTEELLYNMLQSSATIVKKEIKEKEELEEPIDPLYSIIKTGDNRRINNDAYKMLTEKIDECLQIASNASYEKCLNMDFKSEKRSNTIPVEIEHFVYMGQVIYNKIKSLIGFSEMVFSNKNQEDTVTCKHWKLSNFHYTDITEFVDSYYMPIKGFFKNDELSKNLAKYPLDNYKKMLDIDIKDPETKYLVYKYIFVSMYHVYLISKNKSIKQYLDVITTLFNKENKRALNFDLKTIKYEMKLSKKSEAEIKKSYFSKLGSDELVSENTMKNLKLGKWGIGLQKSMFEYDKDTYLQDKTAANEVFELIGDKDGDEEYLETILEKGSDVDYEDEYAAFMPEDDDAPEGFDGDEVY